MSGLLQILFITWGFLLVGFIPAFFIWRKMFHKEVSGKGEVSRWSGFKKKKPLEIQLETAEALLYQGSFEMAEKEYRALLQALPEEIQVHLGLAESLFDQAVKGLRKNPEKRAEALVHYRWGLDFFQRNSRSTEALVLYKRLSGPYSEQELGTKPLESPASAG